MSELYDIHSHAGEQRRDLYNEPEMFPRRQSVEKLIEKYGDRIEKIVTCPLPGTVYFNYDSEGKQGSKNNKGTYPYDIENQALVEAVDKYDSEGRILAFACIHPKIMVSEQLSGLENIMRDNRVSGIKFHTLDTNCGLDDFFGNTEITSFCQQMNLPILIHSANFNNVENCNNIFHWAQLNPKLRICVSHLMNFSQEFFGKLSHYQPENLYTDISPFLGLCEMAKYYKNRMDCLDIPYDDPEEVLAALFQRFGRRILWGSDDPYGKFKLPDGRYIQHSLNDELDFLFSINNEIRTQIASINSKRYIGKPVEIVK